MKGFTNVYILLNDNDGTHRYSGLTGNLEARLKSHNKGNNPHTSKYRPWRIETAIAFRSPEKRLHSKNTLKVILDAPLPQSIFKSSTAKK